MAHGSQRALNHAARGSLVTGTCPMSPTPVTRSPLSGTLSLKLSWKADCKSWRRRGEERRGGGWGHIAETWEPRVPEASAPQNIYRMLVPLPVFPAFGFTSWLRGVAIFRCFTFGASQSPCQPFSPPFRNLEGWGGVRGAGRITFKTEGTGTNIRGGMKDLPFASVTRTSSMHPVDCALCLCHPGLGGHRWIDQNI